ncbi:MAG: GH3 auxin-responsive promoter family protein [Cyclobacteriaceae bacterium]
MRILNSILTWALKKRISQIEQFMINPLGVQEDLLMNLIKEGRNTEYGRKHGFSDVGDPLSFQRSAPLVSYEDLFPYVERTMAGEQNLLWPTKISWFAKSSGTTNARSKFIPVSEEALEDCHYAGGKDLLSLYINNYPETQMFSGKGLVVGGSHQINQFDQNSESYYGDVSAVILKNLPLWAQLVRTPSLDIALMDEWEEKIEKMAQVTLNENVTSMSGVPTWTFVLLQRILEITGKKSILDVWPNIELFVHGAVAFSPYRNLFRSLIPSDDMHYLETYNASEGFFAIQDQPGSSELLLMLDYGIYYEFIPFEQMDVEDPIVLTLDQVEIGKNYALVITTNAGLWRYMIGDTIKFTSTSPYRIKITGRTKHFINAFGEELIIENAEYAIEEACHQTKAMMTNFTAAPKYLGSEQKGSHEWVIEFARQPDNREKFCEILDAKLKEVNSDYDAKRYRNIALEEPLIHFVEEGTFHQWMKKRGKLGGQNKVPRLANNRDYLDDILSLLKVMS